MSSDAAPPLSEDDSAYSPKPTAGPAHLATTAPIPRAVVRDLRASVELFDRQELYLAMRDGLLPDRKLD